MPLFQQLSDSEDFLGVARMLWNGELTAARKSYLERYLLKRWAKVDPDRSLEELVKAKDAVSIHAFKGWGDGVAESLLLRGKLPAGFSRLKKDLRRAILKSSVASAARLGHPKALVLEWYESAAANLGINVVRFWALGFTSQDVETLASDVVSHTDREPSDLHGLGRLVSIDNFRSVHEMVREGCSPEDRMRFLTTAIPTLFSQDAKVGFEEMRLLSEEEQQQIMGQINPSFSREDFRALLDSIAPKESESLTDFHTALIRNLVGRDPELARAWLSEQRDPDGIVGQLVGLNNILSWSFVNGLEDWSQLEPSVAAQSIRVAARNGVPVEELLSRLETETPGTTKEGYVRAIYKGLLHRDPGQVSEWLSTQPSGSAQTDIARTLARSWTLKDPEAAIAWSESLDEAQKEAVMPKILEAALEKSDDYERLFPLSKDWFSAAAESDQVKLAERLGEVLVGKSGSPALAEELASSLTDSARDTLLVVAAKSLSELDPAAASEWISTFSKDSTYYNESVEVLVKSIPDDPERALLWAATVSDEALRANLMERSVKLWKRLDPDGLNLMWESLPFSEDIRAEIEAKSR